MISNVAHHKGHIQSIKPIKTRGKYMWLTRSYQPLFEKRARASPPNTLLGEEPDRTRVSGGNRA